ncbi:uncharacterized protein [Henckelia pumila]|uniref:uncharacterized protein n=1 Tax=Henckelia pumila TaxID=405737 RepID=UPI003C6E3061
MDFSINNSPFVDPEIRELIGGLKDYVSLAKVELLSFWISGVFFSLLLCITSTLQHRNEENTFLEACIENNTKSNLYMDQVEFEPAQNWTATVLKADSHLSERNLLTRKVFKEPILIRAGGGIYNYLYQLRLSSQDSARVKLEGSNILGKLQITWRTNLGEPGRLQTQNILGNPITRKEIELQAVEVPSVIIMEKPFVRPRF